ncbi:MAG: HNH endonuclease [Clostridiales bacterium]|nr:HNH endonuclease [Clostridiales bacterium]
MTRPDHLTPEALRRWIPALAAEGKLYRFYKSPEFRQLRADVLRAAHWECEDCRARSPSAIRPAVTVHHDRPVRQYPELALSWYWVDEHGQKHKQLWALCEDCHNRRHDRFGYGNGKPPEPPLTPERW